MGRRTPLNLRLAVLALLLLVPLPAFAQSDSGIAGVVRDTTGAVLPGVTVEATSPALIEKVRTVATDGEGQYKIVALRPGVYTVTFTLPGFSVVKREGIELTASFTAPVNAELRVGSLEETVTVSGQSPMVDVQNSVQEKVLTHEIIDNIPTGKLLHQMAQLIPGAAVPLASQDVGGSTGENYYFGVTIHGSRPQDMTLLMDGFRYNGMSQAGGGANGLHVNPGTVQEVSLETGGISAETEMGGIRSNIIPKDGGNTIKGYFATSYTNRSLQSDNLTDALKARGLTSVNTVEKIWDYNPAVGGPIKKDTVWFYTGFRYWGSDGLVAGSYYDKDPLDFVYTPDLSRQALKTIYSGDESIRFTWQATPKNKFNVYYNIGQHCNCHDRISATVTPDAAQRYVYKPNYVTQFSWASPISNRLLIEAGASFTNVNYQARRQPSTSRDTVGVLELSTNTEFRAAPGGYGVDSHGKQPNQRFSVSYVTGSHAFKTGVNAMEGWKHTQSDVTGDMSYQFLNGVPVRISISGAPLHSYERLKADLGVFAQDQWTIKRLTLNLGVRFDYLNAFVPEQHLDATRFLPVRAYDPVYDVPNWKDISPRLGAAYNVFGNGKTAIKVSLGRYMVGVLTGNAAAGNPARAGSVTSATRTWTDRNGNFVPEGDFLLPAANGELGPLSASDFGKIRITTRYDQDVNEGWGKRLDNWEGSAGLQHELVQGLSVNASYHRRWYNHFTTTDNLELTPADFDPYCITAPVDPRLAGGGGNQICGLYDVTPAKFGLTNNLITSTSNFGKQTDVFDGLDLTVNGRLRKGLFLSGGYSAGRVATNKCFIVDSPDQRFCEVTPPFLAQFKLLGGYPLPWRLQASATFQSIPGAEATASYVAPNALIVPSLGRNLSAGANSTATVQLIQPGSVFEERVNQLDVRLSRVFTVGRGRIQGMFDAYNVLNAGPILALNTRYGPAWLNPTQILPGRLFKFGLQLDF